MIVLVLNIREIRSIHRYVILIVLISENRIGIVLIQWSYRGISYEVLWIGTIKNENVCVLFKMLICVLTLVLYYTKQKHELCIFILLLPLSYKKLAFSSIIPQFFFYAKCFLDVYCNIFLFQMHEIESLYVHCTV